MSVALHLSPGMVPLLISQRKLTWRAMHRMFNESPIQVHSMKVFSHHFRDVLVYQFAEFPYKEWVEDVHIHDFLGQDMTTAATCAVIGRRTLEANPGLIGALWDYYEEAGEGLAFELPTGQPERGPGLQSDPWHVYQMERDCYSRVWLWKRGC